MPGAAAGGGKEEEDAWICMNTLAARTSAIAAGADISNSDVSSMA